MQSICIIFDDINHFMKHFVQCADGRTSAVAI